MAAVQTGYSVKFFKKSSTFRFFEMRKNIKNIVPRYQYSLKFVLKNFKPEYCKAASFIQPPVQPKHSLTFLLSVWCNSQNRKR
jgi:hypothetical protein